MHAALCAVTLDTLLSSSKASGRESIGLGEDELHRKTKHLFLCRYQGLLTCPLPLWSTRACESLSHLICNDPKGLSSSQDWISVFFKDAGESSSVTSSAFGWLFCGFAVRVYPRTWASLGKIVLQFTGTDQLNLNSGSVVWNWIAACYIFLLYYFPRAQGNKMPLSDFVIQILFSYLSPRFCHWICARLQLMSDQIGMFKLRKQRNPGDLWRGTDFHCIWILTTYVMSTFSNKSVISWPQKHVTDASHRKTAATKGDM